MLTAIDIFSTGVFNRQVHSTNETKLALYLSTEMGDHELKAAPQKSILGNYF